MAKRTWVAQLVVGLLCLPTTAVADTGQRLASAKDSAYPSLTRPEASGGEPGTAVFHVLGAPPAAVKTTSTKPDLASGRSAFLGSNTPFGKEFGSSQNKPYYTFYTASGRGSSVTTVTFARPMPADAWGFALGDIDADKVRIEATGAGGRKLPVSALGFKSTFEYCDNKPKPSTCRSDHPIDDRPNWDASTGTLVGNGVDTYGASAWFMPTRPVRKLTFTYNLITGIPAYQLWMAVHETDVTGCARVPDGDPLIGATVRLLHPDGTPVRDAKGRPATATTGGGDYDFGSVVPGEYELSFDPPDGYEADGPATRTVNVSGTSTKVPCFTAKPVEELPKIVVRDPGHGPLLIPIPPEMGKPAHTEIVSPPEHGTVKVVKRGIRYRPDGDFHGVDHFRFCTAKKGRTRCAYVKVRVPRNHCRVTTTDPAEVATRRC